MAEVDVQNPVNGETACGSLLHQLQKIWDEVGETDEERDKMLLQLEQECLDVTRGKLTKLQSQGHTLILQALTDSKLELSTLLASLGEKSSVVIVHTSLNDATGVQSKNISNDTLARLANTVLALNEDKKQWLKKRSLFGHVTCKVSTSADEVTVPGALALDLIEQAKVEVKRLDM
ncbi:Microtubule-associated protein, MAP65/Ase1/PRC1 [Artemisia annua]|uniref:Microtubule-associated protein, MAP65/Ase1/PRC1 n=1 Tax=Artemisia annua TaxID=35608 RepID=A0A2U1N216_ARTAN|nr:Microtubule-associated protein, MAP65/Ase1/PRC1 [Artemisia annua]